MNKTLPFALALSLFTVPAFAQPQTNEDPVTDIKATVSDFVEAMNGANFFVDATADVAKDERFAAIEGQELSESWTKTRGNLFLEVEKIEVSDLLGNASKAHVSYHWASHGVWMQSETIKEDLDLQMGSGQPAKWQIVGSLPVPSSQVVQIKNMPVLDIAAFRVAHPKMAWDDEMRHRSGSRLKILALGAIMFSMDHNNKFSFNAISYPEALKPYIPAKTEPASEFEKSLQSPVSGERFTFNANLSDYQIPKGPGSPALSQTVLFYEGQDEKLAYLYEGKAAVLFLDRHVSFVTPEQAKKLIWKP